MESFIINLSSCETGSAAVPTVPVGFCVAITAKGSGRGYVLPSTVQARSSMTSKRADCVLPEVLFISSARSIFVIAAPL